ncbi:Receptor homology region, transmembrane domain- and RING domain-containing protein 4 [Sesamum alatum]|uniref:Receptor homology region, transmembrane domain-and RING domain-containing protein 4 n=1 Tax=Sesamum alatum TaxID=300844 RepID=A0AAE2CRH4_9LAMI|nr:Receptor homology region, transmembrane domain- and RING domain-containing protein 4 [Sesamum alatum]
MGSGISRTRSGRSGRYQEQRPRPRLRRAISSLLLCGASSSSREMEDYPAELLVNSAEHGHQEKFKFLRKKSGLSMGNGDDLVSSKSESMVSSRRCFAANGNSAPEDGRSNVEHGNRGKFLSESRELVPSYQSTAHSRGIETASTSYVDQPFADFVSLNEMSSTNAMNTINCNMNGALSQIGQRLNNTGNVYSHGLGGLLLDEVSVENNVSEEVDFSNSDFGSSFISDSPMDTHLPRDDTNQEVTPSRVGFLVSEREHNRQDVSLLQVDVVSISSNILPSNSAEINSREARRNSRRLFWDAFSRRSSRRQTESRTLGLSPGDSESLRSHDRWLLDFTGGFYNDEVGGDLRSLGSRTPGSHELQTPGRNEQQTPSSNGERTPGSNEQDTPGSNEQRWNSRFEIWERLRGNLDSTDQPTAVCPRGIHADGSCSCQSSSSVEESGTRAGISRIVMLAEALFEILDQIHQQPMSLSLSMVSLPAPESVVDSFPVKIHRKTGRVECADDVLQCYICLAEYEEGDKIRVLPCQHEYHMACVDKWLKEIHGVCPLCRGDVREGFSEGSTSN